MSAQTTGLDPLSPASIVNNSFGLTRAKKRLLTAISAIFFVGMLIAYAVSSPWWVLVGLFALTLMPLFPLGKVIDNQRKQVLK
ncbi:MAG: hypothetical protein ACD_17C00067G0001 [uncultured bacterium]|nr:MAG: hypothetical protein ACD_17C00067G0001 [uncultured bacterium]OGN56341.1 MAG: hypothetical protein A2796_02845 [Chlamydiae bacterium RIFCSPHIGHO2_01_FULL_44_39]OGN59067.1 MAG: hypothetical protein A3C42_01225 [Chlamydiae bacterium RIFCSPHIGHO2_02_FULL_45_9]OGN60267.1 MAG: hypothetical protein A3D96_05495 [Chlamydiae bacterium RIFCSPHIGHO2_12_FULL_44_59]OGN67080.1 MAG: hypothetical protein A2978_00550 [Chlamydiae bacterium RIFCSPLOWO2_01_FULL_44_52]OGN67670.1 MAG: hypothetical protein A3